MKYALILLLFAVACGETIKKKPIRTPEKSVTDSTSQIKPDSTVIVKDSVPASFGNGVNIVYKKKGTGTEIQTGDIVKFDYKLMNLRGDVLDGSHKLGFPVAIKQGVGIVPKGLDFALEQLRVGDEVRVEIPSELGFGNDLNSNLVRKGEPVFYELRIADVPPSKIIEGVELTIFHTRGGSKINRGDNIGIDFFGYLTNGKLFDTSRKNDGDFEFTVGTGNILESLDLAIGQMKIGDKAYIEIPAAKAYGPKGLLNIVPPNSDLIYMVTVDYKK